MIKLTHGANGWWDRNNLYFCQNINQYFEIDESKPIYLEACYKEKPECYEIVSRDLTLQEIAVRLSNGEIEITDLTYYVSQYLKDAKYVRVLQ